MKIVINENDCYLHFADIDLGTLCTEELELHDLDDEDVIEFKKNCFQYLLVLSREMIKRFPDNLKHLEQFKNFSYKNIQKKQKFETVYGVLKNTFEKNVSLSTYENQWNKLAFVDWKSQNHNDVPKDIFAFWVLVYEYEDNVGNFFFREISTAVFQIMILPISNAYVERIFSCMNLTKTKLRNKLQYEMLDALIRVKSYLSAYKICCHKYKVPENMLKKFNSEHLYKQNDVENLDELEVYDVLQNQI